MNYSYIHQQTNFFLRFRSREPHFAAYASDVKNVAWILRLLLLKPIVPLCHGRATIPMYMEGSPSPCRIQTWLENPLKIDQNIFHDHISRTMILSQQKQTNVWTGFIRSKLNISKYIKISSTLLWRCPEMGGSPSYHPFSWDFPFSNMFHCKPSILSIPFKRFKGTINPGFPHQP